MKNIVLTGFMASGKTTVGRCIADITGMKMTDTDEVIVEREGRSINDIFAVSGEAYFRDVEHEVCCDLAIVHDRIIAVGGGVVLRAENIEELRKNGIIFLIDVPFEVIEKRLEAARASRPLLASESIDKIRQRYCDRKPFYDNCDYRIPVDLLSTPESIAEKIIEIYKRQCI